MDTTTLTEKESLFLKDKADYDLRKAVLNKSRAELDIDITTLTEKESLFLKDKADYDLRKAVLNESRAELDAEVTDLDKVETAFVLEKAHFDVRKAAMDDVISTLRLNKSVLTDVEAKYRTDQSEYDRRKAELEDLRSKLILKEAALALEKVDFDRRQEELVSLAEEMSMSRNMYNASKIKHEIARKQFDHELQLFEADQKLFADIKDKFYADVTKFDESLDEYERSTQHSTAQHSTAQHSTAQHSTAQQVREVREHEVLDFADVRCDLEPETETVCTGYSATSSLNYFLNNIASSLSGVEETTAEYNIINIVLNNKIQYELLVSVEDKGIVNIMKKSSHSWDLHLVTNTVNMNDLLDMEPQMLLIPPFFDSGRGLQLWANLDQNLIVVANYYQIDGKYHSYILNNSNKHSTIYDSASPVRIQFPVPDGTYRGHSSSSSSQLVIKDNYIVKHSSLCCLKQSILYLRQVII